MGGLQRRWSADRGSGPSIIYLANQVRAAKENLQDVGLERIEMDWFEINLGGAELL